MTSTHRPATQLVSGLALVTAALTATTAVAQDCSARSAAVAPAVVELYTSEGCESCPPADKWLSRLQADPAIVALAFHVDYFDRLGWKDRFASPAYTQRQAEQQRVSGVRFSFTPQVIVNGVDRPDWPRASIAAGAAASVAAGATAPVEARLVREGDRVTATVRASARAPTRLAAYWAVTEQGHVSAVRAGENKGVTLNHDGVVRAYRQVAAWPGHTTGATTLRFDLAGAADAAHPRRVNFVVIDADTGRPVQAVTLGC